MSLELALIKKQATNRLKENLSKAIGLVLICLLACLCIKIINQIFVILLDTVFINDDFQLVLSRNTIISSILTLIMSLFLLSPLFLSVKKWYMALKDTNAPISQALDVFGSQKFYMQSIWFSFVKNITFTIMLFLLLIPAIFIASILKSQISQSNEILGIMFGVLFVAMVIFIILASLYAIYIALGFLYTDYIFLSGKTANPFKAIMLSFQMAKHNRGKLMALLLSFFPYLFLCLFIVPIVFVVPYIKSTLAFYAQVQLEPYEAKNESCEYEMADQDYGVNA